MLCFSRQFWACSRRQKKFTYWFFKKSLKEIRKLTNATLCLENLPRTCLGNTSKELIDIVDSAEGIRVCLDTNHFLQEKTEYAILAIGKRIFTLHISDHDYIDERHIMPKSGKIDWRHLIKLAIREVLIMSSMLGMRM